MNATIKTKKVMWGLMALVVMMIISAAMAGCGASPAPQVIRETVVVTQEVEKVVTQVVEVVVEGTPQVVEKEVTQVVEVVATPTPEPVAEVEQKLRIAVSQLGITLDGTESFIHSWRAEFFIYDSLVRMGTNGQPVPALAESWKLLDDTTWQFKLREGVKFHNGEEFDAEAVKFSIDRIQNPDNKIPYARDIRMIADVEIVDPYTVNISTNGPSPLLVPNLIGVLIIPPKYYAEVGPEGFAQAPIGSGPFKLAEFKPDERAVLERNEEYWGEPYTLETIEFIEMPEQSTRMAALEAGEVDIADGVSVDQTQRLLDAGLEIDAVTDAMTIGFLLVSPKQREEYPFLSDKRVRQALNYAVDKQELADALTGGYGRPAFGTFVGPDGFGYNPAFKAYEYDPDKAKALLAEAGYPDGFTFKMYYPTRRYPYGDEIIEVVAGYLSQIGVTMELEPMENADWTQKVRLANELPTTMFGPNYTPSMDIDRVLWLCHSKFPGQWVAGYPEMDALIDKERGILDPGKRLPVLYEAAAYCADIAPMIWTIFPPSVYAYISSVHDVGFRSDGLFDLATAYIE